MKKIVLLCVLISMALLCGCKTSNQILAEKMIEKYTNDQQYVAISGEVIEIDGNRVVIKSEEISAYISYIKENCSFYIYSSQGIDLEAGDIIDFVTVPFHFYNGHELPIVEVKKNGVTLLEMEEGKTNLLEWVNTTFN